jgi:hypothetical protein
MPAVVAVVCASDMAVVVVPEVFAAGVAAVVGSDVAVARGGSGCREGARGLSWEVVGQPRDQCRRS